MKKIPEFLDELLEKVSSQNIEETIEDVCCNSIEIEYEIKFKIIQAMDLFKRFVEFLQIYQISVDKFEFYGYNINRLNNGGI